MNKYQYFGMFLGFELLRLTIVSFVQLKSSLYAHFYFATQPMLWTLFVLVMLELFQLVLRNHPGIASLGRRALTWSLMASALTSAMTLLIDLQQAESRVGIAIQLHAAREIGDDEPARTYIVFDGVSVLFPGSLLGMRASMHVCWRHTSRLRRQCSGFVRSMAYSQPQC